MKQIVRFELNGASGEMEIAAFTAMVTELCKAVTRNGELWSVYCNKNLKIVEIVNA